MTENSLSPPALPVGVTMSTASSTWERIRMALGLCQAYGDPFPVTCDPVHSPGSYLPSCLGYWAGKWLSHLNLTTIPLRKRLPLLSLRRLLKHLPSPQTPSLISTSPLREIAIGQPLSVTTPNGEKTTLLLQPAPLLTEDFQIALGTSSTDGTLAPAKVFSGWAFPQMHQEAPARAHFAVVGSQATGTWEHADGSETVVRWTLGSDILDLAKRRFAKQEGHLHGRTCLLTSQLNGFMEEQSRASLELPVAAQGGLEPATGQPTRYVDPIPSTEAYALSLQEMQLLLALDQSATGPNEEENLERVASQWLATVANVASIYENQLGIRLRLQELILIPDDPDHADLPFTDALPNFTLWLGRNRPQSQHQWDSAFKVGRGLSSSELGLAYVGSLGRSDSIGVISPHTGWMTLAHELGHSLGANHSLGGLMNAQANDGGNRDFFKAVEGRPKVSAAREIYDHSHERLSGAPLLRHPEEIPFAKNDFHTIPPGESLAFESDDQRSDGRSLRSAESRAKPR